MFYVKSFKVVFRVCSPPPPQTHTQIDCENANRPTD